MEHAISLYRNALGANDPRVMMIDAAVATNDPAVVDAMTRYIESTLPPEAKTLASIKRTLVAAAGDLAPQLCAELVITALPDGSTGPVASHPRFTAACSMTYALLPDRRARVLMPTGGGANFDAIRAMTQWADTHGKPGRIEEIAAAKNALLAGAKSVPV